MEGEQRFCNHCKPWSDCFRGSVWSRSTLVVILYFFSEKKFTSNNKWYSLSCVGEKNLLGKIQKVKGKDLETLGKTASRNRHGDEMQTSQCIHMLRSYFVIILSIIISNVQEELLHYHWLWLALGLAMAAAKYLSFTLKLLFQDKALSDELSCMQIGHVYRSYSD